MKFLIKTLIAFLVIAGAFYAFYKHSGFFLYEHNPMQYMPNMHRSAELKPQRGYDFFEDGSGARVPPAGVMARTQKSYPYTNAIRVESVEKKSNPLPPSREVVMRGRKVYNSTCI